MTKQLLVTLLLCVALALPALAQSSPNSSAQPAASTDATTPATDHATATGKAPLQSKPTNFWDGDEPGLGWLVLHPFAGKKYVQRHTQAVQDRVNELDELTDQNSKMIRDVDGRAQHGIQLASAKVTEGDQHALDATNKAQAAQQTATTVNGRATTVETVVGNIDQYKAANQTVLRFRPGQSALSKQAKDALDQMAGQLKEQHGYVVEVQGFAAGSGQSAIASSRRMADSVVRYLVLNQEIPSYRIYVVGMGNTPETGEDGKRVTGNRVEVSLLKNDIDQLASSSNAAPAPSK